MQNKFGMDKIQGSHKLEWLYVLFLVRKYITSSKKVTDYLTIGNTRVSVAYYSFYDNIQLYEPLGKALLFTSISLMFTLMFIQKKNITK